MGREEGDFVPLKKKQNHDVYFQNERMLKECEQSYTLLLISHLSMQN